MDLWHWNSPLGPVCLTQEGDSLTSLQFCGAIPAEDTCPTPLLAQARRQLNQIIWLNPIPESQWAISPGITALAQHCRMLCCGTLEQLAAACQDAFSQ